MIDVALFIGGMFLVLLVALLSLLFAVTSSHIIKKLEDIDFHDVEPKKGNDENVQN